MSSETNGNDVGFNSRGGAVPEGDGMIGVPSNISAQDPERLSPIRDVRMSPSNRSNDTRKPLSIVKAEGERSYKDRTMTDMECIEQQCETGLRYMMMVRKCQRIESIARSDSHILCNWNGSVKDGHPEHFAPVFYRNVLYRNIHCLGCNELNITSVVVLEPSYSCNENESSEANAMFQSNGQEAFLAFIAKYCRFHLANRHVDKLPKSAICHCYHC